MADNSAYDEITGIAELEGNAIIKDSTNGYSILGNQIYLDKNNNSFLATRKPILIFKGEGNDSTFISADTLFSGVEKRDSLGNKITVSKDTAKKVTVINVQDSVLAIEKVEDSLGNKNIVKAQPNDVDTSSKPDSLIAFNDSSANRTLEKDLVKNISVTKNKPDSVQPIQVEKDSIKITDDTVKKGLKKDSLAKDKVIPVAKDTAIRYFLAFHNVRIFNDSLQSVCDSLYYSSEDSIFRLFKNPLVFSHNSQIAGDTIYMYTKNKKAERLYVFENGIIINKANENMYNQFVGRTLNGYFKDGELGL